jgi:putative endonuclease
LAAVSRLRASGSAAELGRAGEQAAAQHLRSRGYEVVGAGFVARRGEIDLVCRRGQEIVLVEVKTRSSDAFGTPLQAVDSRKRRRLRAAAAEYRALAEWRGPIRFAVVAVTPNANGTYEATLIEDPFV